MAVSSLLAPPSPRRVPCPPPSAPVGGGLNPVAGGPFPIGRPAPVNPIGSDTYDGGYLPESDRGIVFGYPPASGIEPIGGGAAVVLRKGSKGELVAKLQNKLKDAGFDPGAADGVFGPKTEAAVRAFQQQKGLAVDGVVGPQTLGALDVALAHRTVKNGSSGQEVRMLQEKLKQAGFDPGPVDGVFGPKTQAAVQDFQRKKELEADGIVGPKTWGRLGVWQVQQQSAPSGPAPGPGGTVHTPEGKMVERLGKMISAEIADNFDRLYAAAKADGINLQITSGYRSYAEQVVLYNRYKAGQGPIAAPPGHSNHQTGTAIDFTNTPGAWAWLKANAHKYGLHNFPPEPWHYSLNGQ